MPNSNSHDPGRKSGGLPKKGLDTKDDYKWERGVDGKKYLKYLLVKAICDELLF